MSHRFFFDNMAILLTVDIAAIGTGVSILDATICLAGAFLGIGADAGI
jgi:hypothetical protein